MSEFTAKHSIKNALEALDKLNLVTQQTQQVRSYSNHTMPRIKVDLHNNIAVENRASMQFDYNEMQTILDSLLSNYCKVEGRKENAATL